MAEIGEIEAKAGVERRLHRAAQIELLTRQVDGFRASTPELAKNGIAFGSRRSSRAVQHKFTLTNARTCCAPKQAIVDIATDARKGEASLL